MASEAPKDKAIIPREPREWLPSLFEKDVKPVEKLNGKLDNKNQMVAERKSLDSKATPADSLARLAPQTDIYRFANRVMNTFFAQEKGQKALITALSFTTMLGLTWYFIYGPQFHPGIKSNIASIIWISSILFFFQIYDLLVTLTVGLFTRKPVTTSFLLEFIKFFFTLCSTYFYTQKYILGIAQGAMRLADLGFVFTSNGIIASAAAIFFYRFRQMKEITLKSRVAQAEAQYSLLESQMQPHFLFNSLNVLSELIYVDPDMANSMSQKLADLYREILHNSKNKFCTLESELSILEKYVEIQKIRFGDRIRFSSNVSPAYLNLQVPSLMLQTLVENAIKHGIAPRKDGGEIDFSLERVGNLFEVTISNTGELYKGHKNTKRSTGLQNTRNRLDLMYSNKHNFEIYSDDHKTYVKFRITGRST